MAQITPSARARVVSTYLFKSRSSFATGLVARLATDVCGRIVVVVKSHASYSALAARRGNVLHFKVRVLSPSSCEAQQMLAAQS